MFEVGWTEMLVIAIVMIVVVGPKDLPNMLRTFGRTTAKLRAMASDFQKQFNEALKEAELDDVKKSVDELRGMSPMAEIRKQLNPFEQAAADVRSGVDAAMKPKPAADPASSVASTPQAAEPLKNGATTMPGVNGPEAAPAAPVFPAMTDESVVTSSAPAERVAAPKASAAKKPTKPAPAKATPAAKASANGAKVAAKAASASKTQAKAMTAAQPEAPRAKTPAEAKAVAAKAVATKTVATKMGAKAEPKLAAVKKPVAKKTAGAAK
ncbi:MULTISPECIES: Sec-independent protein translocase protein TatB [unclassified Mesorhizobium]|jgi:sec-independent protein translocase protein TatB|uniref:Sec-independent protein translocase protein TatB n=1 Tax=unclassified Mesorhizobium TaxID=325217 RepID=UPI000FCA1EDB|nr:MULTISPECIES: Sec-independent protein translocase protein TatB [unclassified Mesorhizobium]RUT81267.1 twin-arginine translocase subunit TatB [Mesorhizobium sp. M7A.T.Ca.US.000.02.1.1]RUT84738.1 twin-arginine translocase subunit TatB [Mesorhizobium sp. M7A.T.Ca.US.000.02.2.1]RUU02565.1 twin-arginine translocase subunit TatB [Mesorhizobium sp. M7A.T.Ca.TU.009.02.1.1]RUV18868.1 twin-arginine translocase subunit TatB [Mesorhizobium sp. M7A.F.Ca.MR.245.00.0.0]RUV37818.1 twin-arginine translocase